MSYERIASLVRNASDENASAIRECCESGSAELAAIESRVAALTKQRDEAIALLRSALGRSECYDEDREIGETETTRAIRAFIAAHKGG